MKGWMFSVFLGCVGCVPKFVEKYQTKPLVPSPISETTTAKAKVETNGSHRFVFLATFQDVWNEALDTLLNDYNINIVDQKSGIITTEWDSFYLDTELYRNKISMRIRQKSPDQIEISLYNNVEKLKNTNPEETASVWIPDQGSEKEIRRIVHNLSIKLNMEPPQTGEMAKTTNIQGPTESSF